MARGLFLQNLQKCCRYSNVPHDLVHVELMMDNGIAVRFQLPDDLALRKANVLFLLQCCECPDLKLWIKEIAISKHYFVVLGRGDLSQNL